VQFIRRIKGRTRIYTYDIWFKEIGFNAYDDHKVIEAKDPMEALRSLGISDPKVVMNWHDAKYIIEVGRTLVGYFR